MISPMQLIEKIHAGGQTIPGEKYDIRCYAAILRNWIDHVSFDEFMKAEINDCHFYDHLYDHEQFLQKCQDLIEEAAEDTYFSINSFWIPKKETTEIRHLNAFVLDFDFYKKRQFKDYSVDEFYKCIKDVLPLPPTAVISSGRGLYVIYTFHHCSKKRLKLYQAIYKRFAEIYECYGIDPKATNVTQVIRLPGSCNSKNNEEVRILDFCDTNYEITDFCILLKYSLDEVKVYKDKFSENSKNIQTVPPSYERLRKRKQFTASLLDDFRTLIKLRNENGTSEGYRECLLYLARERVTWSGGSINDSVKTASALNELFIDPMLPNEVEKQCRPSANRRCCSIKKMIAKLEINEDEQKKMKILKPKKLKAAEYFKRKRKHSLLNKTQRQLDIAERRTHVFHLRRQGKNNREIADILEVNKSTITRDLNYIDTHRSEFRIELTEIIAELNEAMSSEKFLRSITYDVRTKLLEWLKKGPEALEFSG